MKTPLIKHLTVVKSCGYLKKKKKKPSIWDLGPL